MQLIYSGGWESEIYLVQLEETVKTWHDIRGISEISKDHIYHFNKEA